MTTLPGYHLGETLYQGTRTLVYRGTCTTDNKPVVIKFLRNQYPSFNELVQFRNQYTIAKNLDLPGIVQPLALLPHGNGYALVMPDDGYISLGAWRNGKLSIVDLLSIAIQLAEILHGLDRNRVIHKDIKPANILIHPQTQQVKLIDFSISSLLPKETLQISNPNILEGTLAYLSPEQTGRMNRGIDYRSDFYSLGVTFYELLTGELPFQSDDPMELVHCHIAKSPMGLGNGEEIPQVLSKLVLKLMAKNAENRYQSALGLKYDLEKCLTQWKETGEIAEFELGERDICDRFTIPEKLYGREQEVQTLLDAFERVAAGNSEMMLVAGFSGIGKTAVVNEVHKPIVETRGYFIKGKFDQFNRNIPFSAFVQAFRDLMGQLLGESNTQLQQWKSKILDALGENGKVIIDVIPELENIIGKQPPVPELSGNAAQNRFNLLFGKFVRVFTTKEHPLVLFLDDVQWADSASLNLLKLLMDESETGYLLVLGAYRDNEVFPAHPLMLTLDDIQKQGTTLHTLTLAPLNGVDITRLVADTLLCSIEIATPLSELVYQKTQGNPFFSTQFLVGLYEDGCITFEVDAGYWQCNLAQVRRLALTDDVVAFMVGRLQKLPTQTQEVLKLAACIGNQFDLGTLAVVCEENQEAVATDLWCALQEGFVIPQSETYKFFQGENDKAKRVDDVAVGYCFLHDRVQQAAYSLIRDDRKQATHLNIGRQLWHNLPQWDLENNLFTIVNHLNFGCDLIVDRSERERIARLNLQASQKATEAFAYETSRQYCYNGKLFLHEDSWKENYSLRFALELATIEAEHFNHNLPVASKLSLETLEKVKTAIDRTKVNELQILFEINQNRMNEAISLASDVLSTLGIYLPREPQAIQEKIELLRQEIHLPTEEIASLATLEIINNEEKLAAIRILTNTSSAAYIANPTLFPAIVIHTVRQCIKFGNSPLAASAYSWYGALLCGVYGDIEAGYEFGKLSIKLLDRFNARNIAAKVSNMFNVFVRPWKEPLKNAIADLPKAIQSGFENGDLEYAFYAAAHYCNYLFYGGSPLNEVYQAQTRYLPEVIKAKYEFHEGFLRINQQVVTNLIEETDEPQSLQGSVLDGETFLSQCLENNIVFLVLCFYEAQTRLAYLFEDYVGALEAGQKGSQYQQAAMGTLYASEQNFYYSLALLANKTSKSDCKAIIATNQNQLKNWAAFSPSNFQHKYDLVEAEWYRLLDRKIEAIEMYDRAIARSRINEFLQEEALANELAAKFYLDWGKEKIAQTYMLEAYYCYARWGGKAKTDQLEATYPQLLTPILQQPKSSRPLNGTTTPSSHQTVRSSTSTATSVFDISAAIKASQALSGEIELETLLFKLMQIVLKNAGANNGVFILNNAGTWEVVTQCIEETCELSGTPLDNARTLPVSIICTVQRTQKAVILNHTDKSTRFTSDPYLIQQQPKSLFCTPILNQGQLVGILYLENHLSAGAFTTERVEILNLLCSQAAISIENARLYQQSQNYANKLEGTVQELQQTQQQLQNSFEDLKQAQLQMVQSEKMSALGNLVAGVAHEINNPVGFIGGNLQPAQDYVQDLLGLIDLYQEKLPNPDEELEEEIEAIDLDFLREDLPKLMGSMKLGVDRIAHISTSLRTFSRTDKEHKVPFNLHDGIDSTLLILKHRLKANEQRPGIKIIKNYSKIPPVQCFPGQLNQVFMNLIANAIDAFDEGNAGRCFEEIAASPNRITIQTEIQENRVTIRISDNGVGMPEEIKQRIFEQGFTTKGVGKGTGLGMAIARQIIAETHGGTISCTSDPGIGTQFAIALPLG